MRAVIPSVPPDILATRRRTGAEQWDEMWEGVVHMPPVPIYEHQELEAGIEDYVRRHWARPRKAKVCRQINLATPGGWPDDYRIPDLLLLSPGRFHINKSTHFEGAPDIVLEIHSPGDETYEKLEFYARLGVPKVWIIDRDSKRPEIHVLEAGGYAKKATDPDGWLKIDGTGIEMKVGRPGKLAMRMAGDDSSVEELPED